MHILAPLSTAFLAATAFALPNELATRDRISITLYEDHNFSGNSGTFTLETQSECLGLSNRGWSNRVSSIRVPSGYRCRLWE
ncbi:hypothetical protein B0J11DRAFT_586695 [Dendryphion nanum]|uniref:Beta/gamma crystallin 'Greek key' domain-containing protein n=1 Tax=Dendryphion nanum TaxID=256645 RepID=A0A9P9CXV6_9PLEO|nr:hypothetical protein B0J11DRAFT_586695 [Dendryphion nanum]